MINQGKSVDGFSLNHHDFQTKKTAENSLLLKDFLLLIGHD